MESNIEKIKQEFLRKFLYPRGQDYKNFSYRYTLFQANIQRFLPNLNIENLEELYKQFVYNHCLALFDQFELKKLDEISVVNNSTFDLLPSNLIEPTILATFHYGSFRVINSYLFKQGFKVVLIVEDLDQNVKSNIEELHFRYKEEIKKNNSDFIVLNVKEPSFIFQLKRLLLNGYVLVVYMDGNAGSLKEKKFDKGWEKIDFLSSKMNVKNGIALLSIILKATIIPTVSCWRDNEKIEIKFYKPISLNDYSDRKLYIKNSILKLYSILEENIYTDPARWGCWTNIHKWFERDAHFPYKEIEIIDLKYEFNAQRYSLFVIKDNYYYFDKYSYRVFPIEENLHELLRTNNINKIIGSNLEHLISKNVII